MGKRKISFFANFEFFKPHIENDLSLWCGSTRKDVLENSGHEQARLFTKSFDASFRKLLAINHLLKKIGKHVKRKDNEIMKGEKHCQNKDKV